MGKFCSQCGKPLKEGEVCQCQQQSAQSIVQTDSCIEVEDNNIQLTIRPDEMRINETLQKQMENVQQNEMKNPNENAQQNAAWNPNGNAQQDAAWNPNGNVQQDAAWNPNGNVQQNAAWNPNGNAQQDAAWNPNGNVQQDAAWNPNGNAQQEANWKQNENFQNSAEKIKKEGLSVVARTIRLFKKPVEEVKNMANSNDIMTGLSAVISNMIVILLISIISMVAVRIKIGDYASFIKIPYVKVVFVAVIMSAIYDFGLAGSIFLTVKGFFRENTTFAKMLSVVGGKLLLDSVFVVGGCILAILNGQLGMFVIVFGMVYTFIVLLIGFYEVSELGTEQKVFAYFIAWLIFAIGLSIIYYLVAKSAITDLTGALKYLF